MKKLFLILFIVFSFSLSFTGCGEKTSATEADSVSTTEAPAPEQPQPTDAPTEAPTEEPTEGSVPQEPTEDPTTENPSEEPAIPEYTFEDRNETVYTTDNLNIRKGPSTDTEVVIVLTPGHALTRTGYHEEWSRLEYDGMTVYAASQYLTTQKPAVDNKALSYGYDKTKRGEKNIPSGMNWYIRNWGDSADFLQDTSKNIIYLTMDEGYENGFTPMILDTLKAKNVKCVFFLTKAFVDSDPELVQRMIDEGHILGNHTCSHPANGMPSLSVEEQKADIMKLHNMVRDQFGYEMKLFRFPSGIYSDESLDVVSSLGYRSVFWSFFYRDFYVNDQLDRASALALCVNELHPGAIYLLHAVSETNAHILGDFIDAARAAGYEFGTYPVN